MAGALRIVALALLFGVASLLGFAALAAEPSFTAERQGDFVVVSATVDLPVPPSLAWSVLTDYDNYPRFISSMGRSKVVSRGPEGLVLEQQSEIGALFFVQRVEVRLAVVEDPPRSIVSRSIDGSFKDLTGRYELVPTEGGVRLRYTGRWVPAFAMPPLVGMALVRYSLEKHFSEMMAEILRRAGR